MDAHFPDSLPSPRAPGRQAARVPSEAPVGRRAAAPLLTVRSLCSHNDLTVLVAAGEVDRSSIDVLRQGLRWTTGWTLLDASKVTFCDVAGARLLVAVARYSGRRGHGLVVVGGSRQLMRVLSMVDPTGVVRVHASLAGGLGVVDHGPVRRSARPVAAKASVPSASEPHRTGDRHR